MFLLWFHLQAMNPEPGHGPSWQWQDATIGSLIPQKRDDGRMGRDVFDPFFVPATLWLRENQTVCVPGIVIRQEKPGVQNTETIVSTGGTKP